VKTVKRTVKMMVASLFMVVWVNVFMGDLLGVG
jgi:hypothetical protein